MGRKGKKKQNVQNHPHSSISPQQNSPDQQQNPSGSHQQYVSQQQGHSQQQQSDISQKHTCPKQQSDSPQQQGWTYDQQQEHSSPQQSYSQRQQSNSPQQQTWRPTQQQHSSPQQLHSQRQQSNSPQQQTWRPNQQQHSSPQSYSQRQQSNSPQQQTWRPTQQQHSSPQQLYNQRQQSNSPQQQTWRPNQQQHSSPQQSRQQSISPQQQAWRYNQQQQHSSPQQLHSQRQQSNSPQQQTWRPTQQQHSSPQQLHSQRQQSNSPQQQTWRPNQQQHSSPQQPRQQSISPQQQAWRSNQQQQHSSPQQLHSQRQQSNSPQQQVWRSNQQQQYNSPQQSYQKQQLNISHQQIMSDSYQEQQQLSDSQQQELHNLQQSSFSQLSHSKQSQETAVVLKKIDSLTQNMHDMYLDQIPKRTNQINKLGRNIMVETNMLKLIFAQNFQTNIIHYDVIITPDKPKFLLRTVFEEFRKKQCPKRYPAFDGKKNAYSAKVLPFGDKSKEEEINIFDVNTGKERNFKIYLNKVACLDLSWLTNLKCNLIDSERNQKCIQALDIILRHGPAYQYTVVGRSLFQPPEPGRIVSLSNGLDLWVGVFQSVVIGAKPYLNIDVAHKGFPKSQSVIDLMKELCNVQDLTPKNIEHNLVNINKFLKGLKIQYELPGQPTTKRIYRVNKLVESARENKFRLEDQTLYSVEKYFLQIKKYTIKYPNLPCLWVGSRKNSIYLPAELCTIIAGQVINKDMNKIQTSKMIRETATNTQKRKEKIMNGFAKMNLNQQPTLMNEFHFSVNAEFEKVPARVLKAPKLQYKEKEVTVSKGTWKADKFFSPCVLPKNSWTILNLDKFVHTHDLYNLHDKLLHGGKFLNMEIEEAQTPFTNLTIQTNINNIIEYFKGKKKQNILLVVVILPNLENAYSIVKQISELQIDEGIVTQCIKNQTLKKLSDSTIGNILLKINSKLNGINHIITPTNRPNCLHKPCMIIGADVTHPSPDAVNIPSIAAVAASHDPNAFKYNVEIRLQSPREEIIQDLEEIMIIQLKYFYTTTRQKPQKIIFYRDGVSEGELTKIMHKELSAIKKAIARLEKSDELKIPITFLVVQKRHHVRFFPTDVKNSDDKNFNVQAGTIVDTEITHPTHIYFYLVSHTSIQGTARPTKYRCICNENQMPENEIEELTYYLCHMFARCTRSVSYPAPTYYAHLAAFRARALIHNIPLNIDNLQEEQRKKMTLRINKSSPMFFV